MNDKAMVEVLRCNGDLYFRYLAPLAMMMMMMFIGTETLVTQLVYERSRMHADRTLIINDQ